MTPLFVVAAAAVAAPVGVDVLKQAKEYASVRLWSVVVEFSVALATTVASVHVVGLAAAVAAAAAAATAIEEPGAAME